MVIQELTAEECAAVLSRTGVGRLGCARFDQPYIVPVHVSFDASRRCLYAFSMIGQKIAWMRENPKVCVEVEEIVDRHHWTTVVVFGRYEEIERGPSDADARRRAAALFEQRDEWWLPAAGRVAAHEHQDAVIYRIDIERMTGRRADRPA